MGNSKQNEVPLTASWFHWNNDEYSLNTVDGIFLCNMSSQFYVTFITSVWCAWSTFLCYRVFFFQLTKETTVQATGVASNLVEAIQGAGFKLQTLSLSFDDFDEPAAGAGGIVQSSEWANLWCQMHIIRSPDFVYSAPYLWFPKHDLVFFLANGREINEYF